MLVFFNVYISNDHEASQDIAYLDANGPYALMAYLDVRGVNMHPESDVAYPQPWAVEGDEGTLEKYDVIFDRTHFVIALSRNLPVLGIYRRHDTDEVTQ